MKKILSVFLALCMLCGCSPYVVEEVVNNAPEVAVSETPAQPEKSIYEEDAEYLVKTIEDTHPCFVLDDVPAGYEQTKEEYLEAAKSAESDEKFFEITSKYCVSLKDGHTTLVFSDALESVYTLQVLWYSDGESLYLCDENNVPMDVEVLKIGELDVQTVFDTISTYRAIENKSAIEREYRTYSRRSYMLEYAGMVCDFEQPVVLTLNNGQKLKVRWKKNDISVSYEELMKRNTISCRMIDDVFYIDHDICSVEDPELETVFQALSDAVMNGTSKVIYDVRGNIGGSTQACKYLLQAMDMIPPSIGAKARISDLYLQNNSRYSTGDRIPTGDIYEVNGSLVALPNDEIELLVLCDDMTYSAAMDLCIWVQDGKLGKVVGRGSSNSPNHYGAVVFIELPNLGWEGKISTVQWIRPDSSADTNQIHPDVEVPYGTDTLTVALKMLNNQ